MKLLYRPQIDTENLTYKFYEDKIEATFKGEIDIFDFTDMPNGVAIDIETILEFNPILVAERIEGVLHIELINLISEDATQIEKYPVWHNPLKLLPMVINKAEED